jgi:hydroxymethylglutaryl-CoA lyase
MREVRVVEVVAAGRTSERSEDGTHRQKKRNSFACWRAAGLKDIEVASFVHPKWVPQLADAEELIPRLGVPPGVRYSALVPNMKGLERAIASGIRRIAVFTAASETFNRKTSIWVFRSRSMSSGR